MAAEAGSHNPLIENVAPRSGDADGLEDKENARDSKPVGIFFFCRLPGRGNHPRSAP